MPLPLWLSRCFDAEERVETGTGQERRGPDIETEEFPFNFRRPRDGALGWRASMASFLSCSLPWVGSWLDKYIDTK